MVNESISLPLKNSSLLSKESIAFVKKIKITLNYTITTYSYSQNSFNKNVYPTSTLKKNKVPLSKLSSRNGINTQCFLNSWNVFLITWIDTTLKVKKMANSYLVQPHFRFLLSSCIRISKCHYLLRFYKLLLNTGMERSLTCNFSNEL